MTEVELKAALNEQQMQALPLRLLALGFAADASAREIDVYYNAPDRDFRKTDEALRLRSHQDLDELRTLSLLTYKGPKNDARSSTRQEFETAVQSGETAEKLLQALGYQALFTVDKTRRTYLRGNVTVCLDQVTGLGCFLELECLLVAEAGRDAAVDRLLRTLDTLEIPRDALTRSSYLELLIASATV